jgi:hypothetical protein
MSDDKVKKLQAQVADVSNIMTENINKILDRGDRLDNLEGRSGIVISFGTIYPVFYLSKNIFSILITTEMLSSRADEFRVSSRRVARKMWWQNMKLNLIIGSVVLIIIVVIIVSVTSGGSKKV